MSDLAVKVQSDLIAAMKNKDELRLSVLRMLKSSIQLMQVEKGKEKELTDEDVLVLVRRLIKQRVEAAEIYKKGGAADRAERELAEAKVLEGYQPAQLTDEGIAQIVAGVAGEIGAKGPKDMGKVMGRVMAAVKGRADGNRVKAAVTKHLSSITQ